MGFGDKKNRAIRILHRARAWMSVGGVIFSAHVLVLNPLANYIICIFPVAFRRSTWGRVLYNALLRLIGF